MTDITNRLRRGFTVAVVVFLASAVTNPSAAMAITAPVADPSMAPGDGVPGPEQSMRQSNYCATPTAAADPDVSQPAAGFLMLNIEKAWHYSTGAGIPVAIIDTGVNPNPRLPVSPGGDYIAAGDGLEDCDAHGTIVASVIGARPGPDGVVGVAPDAKLISIRQSSRAYEASFAAGSDSEGRRKAGTLSTLARAIVHAANLGAKVINVSVTACMSAAEPLDQRVLGGAVSYATTAKDAVVIAAAGNADEGGCAGNRAYGPRNPNDPRGWGQVKTISSPSWFDGDVLSVGAVNTTGVPIEKSMTGPWVDVAAPGVGIIGFSPHTGTAVNAYPPGRAGEKDIPFWGTSFSAAYVSGLAALIRSRFPHLTARQVVGRIVQTAHSPARGVDDQVGYGVVDPVAALTFDVPEHDSPTLQAQAQILVPAPPPPAPDHRARDVALLLASVMTFVGVATAMLRRAWRSR